MKKFSLTPVPTNLGANIVGLLERWLPELYRTLKDAFPTAPTAVPTSITMASSPQVVTSTDVGYYTITGGTITALTLTRQGFSVNLPVTTVQVVVSAGDVVTITYTAAPTVNFWSFYA